MKKYSFVNLFLILILILTLYRGEVLASPSVFPLLTKTIYLDAGHGGRDGGASYGVIYEKDINLDITLALKDELIKKGAYIYMIREDDSDLSEEDDVLKKRGDLKRRVKQIDESDALLYLSIHVNAFKKDSSQRGAEVLYTSNNPNNKLLASVLMSHFKKDLVTTRHISKTDLYLYTNTKKPGVLIECGYLTNNNERQLLIDSSYQKKIAEVIANAIVDYFSVVSKLSSKENNVLKFDNNYIYY